MKLLRSLATLLLLGATANLAAAGTADAVGDLVAAGEYQAAVRLAMTIQDEAERNAALNSVGDAVRGDAADSGARKPADTAGGSGADYQPIIDLIISQTGGPGGEAWQDGGGGEGTITPFDSGIRVDPAGVISRVTKKDLAGKLDALSKTARVVDLSADVAESSDLRLVSLTKLEAAVRECLEAKTPVPENLTNLAGLTAISHVFVYPPTDAASAGEVVIAGPAEGWVLRGDGRTVGVESGRPVLQLDDLVTVLRAFGPDGDGVFGCSIDSRPENVKTLQEFVAKTASSPKSPRGVRNWVRKIDGTLGEADVRVYGVPADSRVAHVLVDADYRMKLIGLGVLDAGPRIPGYFDLLADNPEYIAGGLDALRWWMTLNTSAVKHSADRTAFEIAGNGVLCQSENQFLTSEGERVQTGQTEPVNRMFAENFTQHYADLASQEVVFADLQGVMDLALAAALIRHEQLDVRAGWDRGCFADGGAFRTRSYVTPKTADAVAAHRVYNGRDVVVQAAGGVSVDVMPAVRTQSEAALTAPAKGEGVWWSGE